MAVYYDPSQQGTSQGDKISSNISSMIDRYFQTKVAMAQKERDYQQEINMQKLKMADSMVVAGINNKSISRAKAGESGDIQDSLGNSWNLSEPETAKTVSVWVDGLGMVPYDISKPESLKTYIEMRTKAKEKAADEKSKFLKDNAGVLDDKEMQAGLANIDNMYGVLDNQIIGGKTVERMNKLNVFAKKASQKKNIMDTWKSKNKKLDQGGTEQNGGESFWKSAAPLALASSPFWAGKAIGGAKTAIDYLAPKAIPVYGKAAKEIGVEAGKKALFTAGGNVALRSLGLAGASAATGWTAGRMLGQTNINGETVDDRVRDFFLKSMLGNKLNPDGTLRQ